MSVSNDKPSDDRGLPVSGTAVITSIRRNKKNGERCSVFVDDEFFAACAIDIAVSLGLRKGQVMTPEIERTLRAEDRRMTLRTKAYGYATYKPRTERQVRDHYAKLDYTPEEIDDVMIWLAEFRLVDDERYVERFIDASRERKPLSPRMIRQTLSKKGIADHIIDKVLSASYAEDDVMTAALSVAGKKWRTLSTTAMPSRERIDKLVRFMQYRGYAWDVIKRVIERYKDEIESDDANDA